MKKLLALAALLLSGCEEAGPHFVANHTYLCSDLFDQGYTAQVLEATTTDGRGEYVHVYITGDDKQTQDKWVPVHKLNCFKDLTNER